jgi:nicotinamidase-related amidase
MTERIRFPLTSEQCELLAAFEAAGSLTELARLMHRDASVVSRNLQSLAETGVLEKDRNRWAITALGRQVNAWTRTVAASQAKILSQHKRLRLIDAKLPELGDAAALLIVGAQRGFDDAGWGTRNNLHAEEHIAALLAAWRQRARPVYHVQHHSQEPQSPLRPGTIGAAFKDSATPRPGETVLTKSRNSAFVGAPLEATLRERGHTTLVFAGFSTNHCVDSTARAAGDLGFSVFVVADACVAFDRISYDGTHVRAEDVHRSVMANLHQEYATVLDTSTLLTLLDTPPGDGPQDG